MAVRHPLLSSRRDPYLVRAGNINLAQLGLDTVRAQVAFSFRRPLGVPAKEILVLQDRVQLFQERRKRDWRLQSLKERIPAGLVRNLRQVALSVTYPERVMARAADSGAVQRVNNYAGFFRRHVGVLDVRAEWIAAEAIDAIRDQQNFTAYARGHGPSFDQAHSRKVNARISGEISQRQPQSLGHRVVVVAELRNGLHPAVAGIKHADPGRLGLARDE